MARGRKLGKIVGAVAIALVLLVAVMAPSWRNYYFHRDGVRILEDQAYVEGSADPAHRLDLYLPEKGPGPFPVVVFVHGGFYKPLHRRTLQPLTGLHGCVGVALARQGIATAVIDYRQYPEATSVKDALDDISRAVRYVEDHIA